MSGVLQRLRAGSRARRRDRSVYLAAHPVLFALLALTRVRPVVRLGRTVVVNGTAQFREAAARVPLDRAAPGSTGGAARAALRGDGGGMLFDQDAREHRAARQALAGRLGAPGVAALRPVWTAVLERRLAPLACGGAVELVATVEELAGATVCALLGVDAGAREVALAAGQAAALAVRAELPGAGRDSGVEAVRAAERLRRLLGATDALGAVLAVAAVNTTVAALPRAAAWCADDGLWDMAADASLRPALVEELLRVVAPSPLLPRVAAADAVVGGRRVRAGDRLLLVARHAAGAHLTGPDPCRPAPAATACLVFGSGAHSCPGARLARAQLADFIAALAPHQPVVVAAWADRDAALPGYRTLTVRAAAGCPRDAEEDGR